MVINDFRLGDITPEVAKRFVITHLESNQNDPSEKDDNLSLKEKYKDIDDLDECIQVLGGRLTDLQFLARRIKAGLSPKRATAEIIEQSAWEILKLYLLTPDKGRPFSPEQIWYLVKSLAANESLRYNEILLSNTFALSLTPSAENGESALEALSAAELITIKTSNGRPQTVRAGKPVYQAAFKLLAKDKVLKSRLDLAILTELTKIETKSIDKYEAELSMLGSLPRQPREVGPRVQFLLSKLSVSQQKVESWEKEMGALKKVLMDEY